MAIVILKISVFVAAGGMAGYLLSRLLCIGGSCPLISNRPIMAFIGAILGLALAHATGVMGDPTLTGWASSTAPLVSTVPTLTTPQEFDDALAGTDKPVVVDFYADWCGPCRALSPVVEKLQSEWLGRAVFYRVNVDRSQALAARYGVDAIPHLAYFKDGKEARLATEGLRSKAELTKVLDSLTATTTK